MMWGLTPSLSQPVKFPGWKVHTCTPPDAVFDGPITNLHSALCILLEIPLCAHAKGGKKGHNDVRFGTFIGRFPTDPLSSMAVKWLMNYTPTKQTYVSKVHSNKTDLCK